MKTVARSVEFDFGGERGEQEFYEINREEREISIYVLTL